MLMTSLIILVSNIEMQSSIESHQNHDVTVGPNLSVMIWIIAVLIAPKDCAEMVLSNIDLLIRVQPIVESSKYDLGQFYA